MSFRCVSIALILLNCAYNVIMQNKIAEECGIQTSENQLPWLVGVEFKTSEDLVKRLHCSGALISRRHVLTNVACFNGLNLRQTSVHRGQNISIIAGSCLGAKDNRCQGDNSIRVPIEMLILHPEYIGIFEAFGRDSVYDIAILKLRKSVLYSDFIQPICIPSFDVTQLNETDRDLYVTGLHPRGPYYKQKGGLTFVDRTECQGKLVAKDEICAVDTEPLAPCLAPGGLVINKKRDRYELVGLVTDRSRCNSIRVFSDLYMHLDWIRSNMVGWTLSDGSWIGCGRRKVDHTELIMHGEATKIGDWPWHVAIYRLHKSSIQYICGGTLISKTMILTAAHCVTIKGETVNPETLSVVLGKYHLIGKDLESQEKEVHSVIVHESFAPNKHFENDIALLKLRTEATYNDYVQPACIWSKEASGRLPSDRDFGTVVGWGIDQSEQLSSNLKQASMPKVPDVTCIKRNPLFYTTVLENNKKFCAGWANGTSPCNGDSGGGFLVFVPDTANDTSADALGSWYVRGIVSITAIIRNRNQCDPYQYVVFTDVDKYTDWIQKYLDHQ